MKALPGTPLALPVSPGVDPTRGVAATPIAFIRAIVDAYHGYGADPARALHLAHIPPSLLENPRAHVTALQLEIMSAVAMQELDDEALGWFSRRLPWGSYGLLCRASLGAPDLAVALKRWCRHHRILIDDVRLALTTTRSSALLTIERRHEPPAMTAAMREFCQLTLLRYLLGYACWAVDSRIALQAVSFPFPPPPHQAVYELLFDGRVQFDADLAGIRFDAEYLKLPIRRDEAALRAMLQRALPLTVLQYRRDRLVVQRVRQLLAASDGAATTAEALAGQLHLSARSLHRQLGDEGASLQRLKDETRRDRAIDLLRRSRRPIKQVAQAVGFRNEKSFIRAFRQWTGMSPGAFRSHVGGEASPAR